MRFKRLRLTGFKSFVEPAEIRIEPGLTGVVGPNGCGKSNLLEALRWVMGEGSPRSLRGGGMDDVIFAGTATRPARDFAEVALLLEDAAGSEHEVSRRIDRGEGSTYRIDGRDVRQKDVALLFADAATGAHSPALVSQGRIAAVIAARPAERRQMLEEAAGIAGLHVRRKDAEQKLRATEVNLERLDEILGQQEQRANSLRRQARAAARYTALSGEIRLAEARLLHARWTDASVAADAAATATDAASIVVERLTGEREAAQGAQAGATALAARCRDEAGLQRDEVQALAHGLATDRAALDAARRRLAELARSRIQFAAEFVREEALQAEAASARKALAKEIEAIAARIATAQARAAQDPDRLATAQVDAREAESALAELLARTATRVAQQRLATAGVESARAQLARLDDEARHLAATGDRLDEEAELVLRRDRAAQAATAAARDLSAAQAALLTFEGAEAAAAAAREAAIARRGDAHALHAAARSEADALAADAKRTSDEGLLAQLTVAPGFEAAVAAALGDDLAAPLGADGPSGWTGSESGEPDPSLAPGLGPLAAHVTAPPELARRLAQIGVAEHDEGQPLAPGQRLVTRAGEMRRWDGFFTRDTGAAAAQRLRRANRRLALKAALLDLAAALHEAELVHAAAEQAQAESGSNFAAARQAVGEAQAALRHAQGEAGEASAALDRQARQRAALDHRLAELLPLLAAARAAFASAEAAATAPDIAGSDDRAVTSARALADTNGRALAALRADLAESARALVSDRARQLAATREQSAWAERVEAATHRSVDCRARLAAVEEETAALAGEPDRLAARVGAAERNIDGAALRKAIALAAERRADEALAAAAVALHEVGEHLAAARESRAAASARAEAQAARRAEIASLSGERFSCPPALLPQRFDFDPARTTEPATASAALDRLTAERERIGPVNLVAERELGELDRQNAEDRGGRSELAQAVARLRGSIANLNREGRARLLAAFEAVDRHFRSLFSTLFEGGQAHLSLVDSDDPLEAGLEIMAQPPGKRLAALSLLSGGEQALTAAALIFALFLTRPAPICVLDEVDAPLDDANVERFCDLLARMTRETATRYLVVTHNAVTMSRMDRLYGVTMIERGVSRLVSVNLASRSTDRSPI